MKKTMTVLGDTGDFFPEGMKALMKQDLRLLFVSEDEARNFDLMSRLEQTEAVAEVEFTSCERDGCWEADIILITQPNKVSLAMLDRIKEVATQKIVLAAYDKREKLVKSTLQQVLPYSKVVQFFVDSQKKELIVFRDHPEIKGEVQELFSCMGFQMQQ